MTRPPLQKRTLALLALTLPLAALFAYVALRSGPLAPVPVVLATVEERPLSPALFGIGTIEARYTYRIGPTFAGRVKRLDVHVGDMVKAGQVLGVMDPVDLDERVRASEAGLKAAGARLEEAKQAGNLERARLKKEGLSKETEIVSAALEDAKKAIGDAKAKIRMEKESASKALKDMTEEMGRSIAEKALGRSL